MAKITGPLVLTVMINPDCRDQFRQALEKVDSAADHLEWEDAVEELLLLVRQSIAESQEEDIGL